MGGRQIAVVDPDFVVHGTGEALLADWRREVAGKPGEPVRLIDRSRELADARFAGIDASLLAERLDDGEAIQERQIAVKSRAPAVVAAETGYCGRQGLSISLQIAWVSAPVSARRKASARLASQTCLPCAKFLKSVV